MPEVQEVFRMATQKIRPEPGALERQLQGQRRAARSRKAGAIALAAALIVSVVALGTALSRRDSSDSIPGGDGTMAPTTQPPFGAQIVDLDGSVIEQIPKASDGYGLRLSPDGSTIAFITPGRISTIGVGGADITTLVEGITNNAGDAQDAVSWSPDGSQIAYVDDGDLYVMNADGSNIRQLTTDPKGDYYPAWSPDGSTIAYWNGSATGEDGGPADSEIYTIPAGGGTPTRLTHERGNSIEPAWSPDGTQIAYFNDGELWVMASDGSDQHPLSVISAIADGAGWAPAWSPDGTRIVALRFDEVLSGSVPLMNVVVFDLRTGTARDVGVRVATDLNGVTWASNDTLLINRYD